MERAVTKFGAAYGFSATYFGKTKGYVVDNINGTESDDICVWNIFVEFSDGTSRMSSKSVTNTNIRSGQSLIMRYESLIGEPTVEPTGEGGLLDIFN